MLKIISNKQNRAIYFCFIVVSFSVFACGGESNKKAPPVLEVSSSLRDIEPLDVSLPQLPEFKLGGRYRKIHVGRCGSTDSHEPPLEKADHFILTDYRVIFESYGECSYQYTYKIIQTDRQKTYIEMSLSDLKLLGRCSIEEVLRFEKLYKEYRELIESEKIRALIKLEQKGRQVTISNSVIYLLGEIPNKEPDLDTSDCYEKVDLWIQEFNRGPWTPKIKSQE